MRSLYLGLCFLIVFGLILLIGFRSLDHLSTEFDEGVYLTTFKLVDKGMPIYSKIFFSQPPGFFIFIYPLYSLFGKTLEAGRLAIFCYSIFGLLAVIWLGFELEMLSFSILTIGILYSMRIYTQEIFTFHADSLSLVFSILVIACLVRFKNSLKSKWLYLSSFCLGLAVITKFDVSTLLPIIFVIIYLGKNKKITFKQAVKQSFVSILILFGFIFLVLVYFNLKEIYENVLILRFQAGSIRQPNFLFLNYLESQKVLLAVLISGIGLGLIALKNKIGETGTTLMLLTFTLTVLLGLLLYHPLQIHHLVLLTMPSALLFSYSVCLFIQRNKLKNLTILAMPVLMIIFLCLRFNYLFQNTKQHILNPDEEKALAIIYATTNTHDLILSDDELLMGVSNRLPPPNLADVSLVRIQSGNLNSVEFAKTVAFYKPKLIIPWSSRLRALPNLEAILKQNSYRKIFELNDTEQIYSL